MPNFIKLKFNDRHYPVYINVEHITFISKTITGENFTIEYIDQTDGLYLEVSKNIDAIEQLKQYGVIL